MDAGSSCVSSPFTFRRSANLNPVQNILDGLDSDQDIEVHRQMLDVLFWRPVWVAFVGGFNQVGLSGLFDGCGSHCFMSPCFYFKDSTKLLICKWSARRFYKIAVRNNPYKPTLDTGAGAAILKPMNKPTALFLDYLRHSGAANEAAVDWVQALDDCDESPDGTKEATFDFVAAIHLEFLKFVQSIDIKQAALKLQEEGG